MAWIRAPNQVFQWETEALKMGAGPWGCPRASWDKWRWVRWVLQELRNLGAQTEGLHGEED